MMSKDVLLAVSSALNGDRQSARGIVDEIREQAAKRVQRPTARPDDAAPAPIRGARLPAPKSVASMAPGERLKLRLPDGQQMHVVQVARHRDLVNAAEVEQANAGLAFAAISHNGRAIDRLAAAQEVLAERLNELSSDGDLGLLRGMFEGLAVLEGRLRDLEQAQRRGLAVQARSTRLQARLTREVKNQARNASVQKFQGTVASLQSIAMSTDGELFKRENVLLALNQLGWNFGEQVFQSLGGGTATGLATVLGLLAPLGNLAAGKGAIGRGFVGRNGERGRNGD